MSVVEDLEVFEDGAGHFVRVRGRWQSNSSTCMRAENDSTTALTPYMSRKPVQAALCGLASSVVGHDPLVDLSSDESFQAGDDVSFG